MVFVHLIFDFVTQSCACQAAHVMHMRMQLDAPLLAAMVSRCFYVLNRKEATKDEASVNL